MKAPAAVTYAAEGDRVGWITFDDPAGRANVFNPGTLADFADALTAAERDRPVALVLASAKPRIFIAGADLKWLAALREPRAAAELSRTGQQLFQRVAEFPVPVVCAIHGACAGGGYELALACHWRIASRDPVTRLGLPETGIGTIPGWGGCVRLLRLIGAGAALDHILAAKLVEADDALRIGLVDEVVAAEEWRARAGAAARRLAVEGRPRRAPVPPVPPEYFRERRAQVEARTRGRLPALRAAVDVVEQAGALPIEEAFAEEARCFGAVTAGVVCKNLLRVHFLRDSARKRTLHGWFESERGEEAGAAPIRRVGVVGAGLMGSGIAHWLAVHGFEVVLREVAREPLERGLAAVQGLLDDGVRRSRLTAKEAGAALQRIAPTTDWDGFEHCDLVIEAIVEDIAAKRRLFAELAARVRPDTVLASNTSALPIEEIAGEVPHPGRTVGLHFFNPVSRMPLLELVIGERTSAGTAARALALAKALGKTPVLCRSSPGFLVTRVLFFYLNEAVRWWEQGVPTVAVDEAMREFGWPMGPLRLIDEVGFDVTECIFGELARYFPDRFARSTACAQLRAAGLLGRKNGAGAGFYVYQETESTNEAVTRSIAGRVSAKDVRPGELCRSLMGTMTAEARRCLAEGVVKSADDVDFALLSGAGFPAYRGGLLHWAGSEENAPPG